MTTPAKTDLLLFDIDGTLIASGGAGEYAINQTIRDRFDCEEGLGSIEIAGRTDSFITRRVLERFGVEPTPEAITSFLDGYLAHLARELPVREGRQLPGVLPLLDALRLRPHVVLALLTGNLAKGAHLKLSHYGLWDYFEFGAYADDSENRNLLGPVAQTRASERHGVAFSPERIVVIGDTPHDIECGRAIGARTVAVATGSYSLEELAEHGPTFLYADLSHPEAIIADLGW